MPAPNPVSIFAPGLNRTGLRWMAVGSIASNAYGEFRVTNDVDLILLLDPADAPRLTEAFPAQHFYCPPTDVIKLEAARSERGHFNLIDHATGFKADVYLASGDHLLNWAFDHRRQIVIDDMTVWVAPPEYVILGKLEFFRRGGSEKHLRDIRGIVAVTDLDRPFLEREINTRGLSRFWHSCVSDT